MIPFRQGTSKSNRIVFRPYSKKHLMKIIESKIGSSVVDTRTLGFICSKVAATSGDARKVEELVSSSIHACLSMLSESELDSELEKPVVKLPHVMVQIRASNPKYCEIVRHLPTYQQMTLSVGVILARTLRGKPITLGRLKGYSMEAFGFDPDYDFISTEDFKGIIENLYDTGLLKLSGVKNSNSIAMLNPIALMERLVRFDLQLEDVESALQQELLQQSFYKNMVARLEKLNLGDE